MSLDETVSPSRITSVTRRDLSPGGSPECDSSLGGSIVSTDGARYYKLDYGSQRRLTGDAGGRLIPRSTRAGDSEGG